MEWSLKLKIARILSVQEAGTSSRVPSACALGTLPARREAAAQLVCAVATIPSICRWLEELEACSPALLHHSVAVAGLVTEFSEYVGMGGVPQGTLVAAALLHDIGKLQTPPAILNKPGKLTFEEMEEMQRHPMNGYELLRVSENYSPEVLDAVRHHHEKLDGSGYPDGLSGAEVSWTVRLIAVCDIYAALTAERAYRKALSPSDALSMMQAMTRQLDVDVLGIFSKFLTNTIVISQPV